MDLLQIDLGPGVTAIVTTRAGGVSRGPYSSLNLAFHVGDEADAVRANRAAVEDRLGHPVVYGNQVHGTRAALVDGAAAVGAGDVGEADCLLTARAGVALAVMVADCLPVLIADGESGVVAAVHAGRRGLVDGVLPAALEAMRLQGGRPAQTVAYLGPAICGRCYEVGPEVREEVTRAVPAAASTTSWGTPAVDLAAGAETQLRSAGVVEVRRSELCTLEDERFYSYRRDRTTGRFVGVVVRDRGDTP